MRKLFPSLIIFLFLVPISYAGGQTRMPVRHNMSAVHLGNVSILDIADPRETFEWDSPPDCNPTVNTTAWISGDGKVYFFKGS